MATRRVNDDNVPKKSGTRRRAPARTLEERENQMIALAVDNAERMMREGTAPAQIVTHYLKLGSSRERLEKEKLASEVSLLKIKEEAIASEKRVEELYREAMDAFRSYSPTYQESEHEYED